MADTETPSDKTPQAQGSPRLRDDLRVVYDNPTTGKGKVRLIDPGNGRQFAFDEQEFEMCRAANGTASLDEIRAQLQASGQPERTQSEVIEFFRRLQILGLLAPEGSEPATDRQGPGQRGAGLRGGRRASLATGTGRMERSGTAKLAAKTADKTADKTAARTTANTTAENTVGTGARISAGDPSASVLRLTTPPARTGTFAASKRKPSLTKPLKSADADGDRPDAAAATTGPEAGPITEPPEAAAPIQMATQPNSSQRQDTRPARTGENRAEAPSTQLTVPPAPTSTPDVQDDGIESVSALDFFNDDLFSDVEPGFRGGGMGGGMAGGMAGRGGMGMRGGMRGGGMGGGGMGGGMDMGAGMAGGMGMGGMAMAGGMGGAMGGGRRGRGPNQANTQQPELRPAQLPLLNPHGLLRLLYIVFYPLKLILWGIVPLVVMAGLSVLNNLPAIREDMVLILRDLSSVTQFLIGLFVINLFARLAQGVAIVAHGGKVSSFGIGLVFGVLPRFFVDKSAIAELDRQGQLWAYGAPLLARLSLFVIGTLTWAINREQGGLLPEIALITGQFGLFLFLLTAFPLMPSDGLRWLSTMFNQPKLIPKAAIAFKHVFMGGPLPNALNRNEVASLTALAVGIVLTVVATIGVIAVGGLVALEAELGGLGVILFLGLLTSFILYLLTLRALTGQRAQPAEFDRGGFRQMAAGRNAAKTEAAPEGQASLSNRARVVWALIGIVLLALAFQPYAYNAGGQVEILPSTRSQAVARTDGELISVSVTEGEIVQRGQVLGQLSSWDQERQILVTDSQLTAAKASLDQLQAGPKPEEVELARRQVTSSEASVAFSQAEADRARDLAATGVVSQQAYEKALSTLETDLANLDVARANLDLVLSGATVNDIAIAQAEVDRLTAELAFQRDELERAKIVAPMDGRVVTANLQLLNGRYLRAGEPLLEIENADMVTAAIAVPESDISLIALGDVVRLKAWGQSSVEIEGTVQAIAPAASQEGYGSVVRVSAVFPNPDDFLRSGMTGYAKIEGAEMRTWEAYLRSIRRFFQVEVWSWIP